MIRKANGWSEDHHHQDDRILYENKVIWRIAELPRWEGSAIVLITQFKLYVSRGISIYLGVDICCERFDWYIVFQDQMVPRRWKRGPLDSWLCPQYRHCIYWSCLVPWVHGSRCTYDLQIVNLARTKLWKPYTKACLDERKSDNVRVWLRSSDTRFYDEFDADNITVNFRRECPL